jgi:hypothetical protein
VPGKIWPPDADREGVKQQRANVRHGAIGVVTRAMPNCHCRWQAVQN